MLAWPPLDADAIVIDFILRRIRIKRGKPGQKTDNLVRYGAVVPAKRNVVAETMNK